MTSRPRLRSEHAGSNWKPSPNVCPKCKGECEILSTPTRRNPQAIECLDCGWFQQTGALAKKVPESPD